MNENAIKTVDVIDIVKKIFSNKKLFLYTLPISFVVSCALILSVPRYYKCNVKLAPETDGIPSGGSLSSLASSFGFDVAKKLNNDAISPELYPDLMNTADFMVSLFPMRVTTKKGDLSTTYYDYIKEHTKQAWWGYIFGGIKSLFEKKEEDGGKVSKGIDPFMLTKTQMDIVGAMQGNISCDVDKKTDVISIEVTDQDPLVCATMADSVRVKLQEFITRYRTNKARIDLDFTKKLYIDAKKDYEKARQVYASYSDANQDVILQSYISKKEDLENDMQLKFNMYSTLSARYQAALAKVQERTPAFTILQGASVPVKPAGPKRMIFVLVVMFFTFVGTSIYIVQKK